jgi:hypothetical protein
METWRAWRCHGEKTRSGHGEGDLISRICLATTTTINSPWRHGEHGDAMEKKPYRGHGEHEESMEEKPWRGKYKMEKAWGKTISVEGE